MYCSKCGTQNPDSAKYCKGCGSALAANNAEAAPSENQKNFSLNPILNVIKKVFSSTPFLVAMIAFSVHAGLKTINILQIPLISESLRFYLDEFSLGSTFDDSFYLGFDAFLSGLTGASLISLIPTALLIFAGWSFYSSAKNNGDDSIKTSPITIAKVLSVIHIVLSSILVLFSVAIMVLVSTVPFPEDSADEMTMQLGMGVIIGVFLFLAAVLLFNVFFLSKTVKSLSFIKHACENLSFSGALSKSLPILLYIFGALNGLAIFSGNLASGALGVSYICIAITLQDLQKEIDNLIKQTTLNQL
ncbi:MAG: zinc ribbon domain-containing protein [Clostridia bacterium]|nr:zinc ribbon domain-containing protein [Clostridia bacterium]